MLIEPASERVEYSVLSIAIPASGGGRSTELCVGIEGDGRGAIRPLSRQTQKWIRECVIGEKVLDVLHGGGAAKRDSLHSEHLAYSAWIRVDTVVHATKVCPPVHASSRCIVVSQAEDMFLVTLHSVQEM